MDPARARITRRFPLVMVIYTLVFYGIFMAWYIRPYQQATGSDALSEIIILSSGPILWIATAIFAWRMIRKSYG
ncbi:MAG: hypothetical protein ACI9H8_002072 [Lysobacterales bacterium]